MIAAGEVLLRSIAREVSRTKPWSTEEPHLNLHVSCEGCKVRVGAVHTTRRLHRSGGKQTSIERMYGQHRSRKPLCTQTVSSCNYPASLHGISGMLASLLLCIYA